MIYRGLLRTLKILKLIIIYNNNRSTQIFSELAYCHGARDNICRPKLDIKQFSDPYNGLKIFRINARDTSYPYIFI